MAETQEPIPTPDPEQVARASCRRPVVASRYPRVHLGEMIVVQVLGDVLRRFGVPMSHLAEDLGVPASLVGEWCRGQRAMPWAAVLGIRNRRLRETLLRAGEHAAASNDNQEHE
jgi:hypothetical protein